MKIYFIMILGIIYSFNLKAQTNNISNNETDSIIRIEMHLSAFGVESDHFPSIDVSINLNTDSSLCKRSYYNPQYKESTYTLSKEEIQKIRLLLHIKEMQQLKTDYTRYATDQPKSITTIYTTKTKFTFSDYGLVGDSPLKELYEIVYKLE